MKNTIKALLPQPAINTLRKLSDIKDLNIQQTALEFNTSSLTKLDANNINDILTDNTVENNWKSEQKEISLIFGNDDKFEGVNPGDRRALYALISKLKPQNVLEVGTHVGSSTLHIARALKKIGQGGHVTSVDILDVNAPNSSWKRIGLKKPPIEFAKDLECDEHITFVAQPCLNFMKETKRRFDLIFLDGDHTGGAVYQEVAAALETLNPEGLIVLHDYYPNGKKLYADNNVIYGPYLALKRIEKENPEITVIPLNELPWDTKQGSKKTSLAIVTKKA